MDFGIIGDKDGFCIRGIFNELHTVFQSKRKAGCTERIAVNGTVTDNGYFV